MIAQERQGNGLDVTIRNPLVDQLLTASLVPWRSRNSWSPISGILEKIEFQPYASERHQMPKKITFAPINGEEILASLGAFPTNSLADLQEMLHRDGCLKSVRERALEW